MRSTSWFVSNGNCTLWCFAISVNTGLVAYSIIERRLLKAEAGDCIGMDEWETQHIFSPSEGTSISTSIVLWFSVAPEPVTSASWESRGSETSAISWSCNTQNWGVVAWIIGVNIAWAYKNRSSCVWWGRTAEKEDDEKSRAYHPKEVFGHQEQRLCSNWTSLSQALDHKRRRQVQGESWQDKKKQEKTPIVVTTAAGVPAFPRRLKEGETVEIGDWQSNNVFAGIR